MAMPIILKWLIAAGFFVCLMIIGTFFPHSIVRVLGRPVSTSNWWVSGAGPSMLVVAGLFCSAGYMVLKRSRQARLAYVVAWIALSISIPYAIEVTGGGDFDSLKSSSLLNLVLTLAIGLYLYCSPDSRKYFRSATQ